MEESKAFFGVLMNIALNDKVNMTVIDYHSLLVEMVFIYIQPFL